KALSGLRRGGRNRRRIEKREGVERLGWFNGEGNYMAKTMALVAFSMLSVSSAFAQAPFYQGKTITIIHGRSAGGSGDYRARAVAPFLQKYIPGNPTIVHDHMDGGGGRKAANHIFNTARPDGLTIGSVG